MTKPAPTDYIAFLEAARGHEANARATGSVVDAELARLMHREAVNLRQAALYPPERCVDCGGTIHSDQRQCWNMVTVKSKRGRPRVALCGRARQGVQIGEREVINLIRFFAFNGGASRVAAEEKRQARVAADRSRRLERLRSTKGDRGVAPATNTRS